MTETTLTRRGLFAATAAATLAGKALLQASAARADTVPPAPATLPSIYPRRLGDSQLLAIADGYVTLPVQFIAGLTEAQVAEAQQADYAPDPKTITAPVTSYIYRRGDRLVLIDTGAGNTFGPTTGRFPSVLAGLGIAPETVTDVVLTHLHPDHVGGLLQEGPVLFPNATVHVEETELAYWTDASNANGVIDLVKPFFQVTTAFDTLYRPQFATFKGEVEILPGLRSVPLPGHTLSHVGFHLADGDDEVLVVGDAVVFAAFQFTHPEAVSIVDADAKLAIETRRKLLDRAVADRTIVAGTHLPFPGFGHVEARDGAYAWVPEAWRLG